MAVLVVRHFGLFGLAPAVDGRAVGGDVAAIGHGAVRHDLTRPGFSTAQPEILAPLFGAGGFARSRKRILADALVFRLGWIGSAEPPALAAEIVEEPAEVRGGGDDFVLDGQGAAGYGGHAPAVVDLDAVVVAGLVVGRRRVGRIGHVRLPPSAQLPQPLALLPPPLRPQQIAEHVKEEDDGHRVQEGEENLNMEINNLLFLKF